MCWWRPPDMPLAFELAAPLRFARECAAPATLCVRMPDGQRLWLTRASTVYGRLTDGGAYDLGTPESYAEAQCAFRAMQDDSPG